MKTRTEESGAPVAVLQRPFGVRPIRPDPQHVHRQRRAPKHLRAAESYVIAPSIHFWKYDTRHSAHSDSPSASYTGVYSVNVGWVIRGTAE